MKKINLLLSILILQQLTVAQEALQKAEPTTPITTQDQSSPKGKSVKKLNHLFQLAVRTGNLKSAESILEAVKQHQLKKTDAKNLELSDNQRSRKNALSKNYISEFVNSTFQEKQTDQHLVTLLANASFKGDFYIVELLLEYGANPNLTTFYNITPLMLAAAEGHDEIVELLLEYEANPLYREKIPGNKQRTALDIAVQNKHQTVADILIQHQTRLKNVSMSESISSDSIASYSK